MEVSNVSGPLPGAGEEVRVLEWRFEQLRALGFSDADAEVLAASAVDLGSIRSLMAKGCPPEAAVRIVL